MEKYKPEELSEIGEYNNTKDSYYDTSACGIDNKLKKIILHLNQEKNAIIGVELFYFFYIGDDGYSTGIFKSPSITIIPNNKIDITINHDNPIVNINGSFISKKIIKLVFQMKNGDEIGFNNEKDYDLSKVRHYIMKTPFEISGFKLAFYDELKYFSPVNKVADIDVLKKEECLIQSPLFGKQFADSKEYNLLKQIAYQEESDIKEITVYHDEHLVMGIKIGYAFKSSPDTLSYETFGLETDIAEKLELIGDEHIVTVMIRSGDMIDAILLETNKGQTLISGGNGGGLHTFNIEKIKKKFNINTNVMFLGFSGKSAGCLHQIQPIFKVTEK